MEEIDWKDNRLNLIMIPVSFGLLLFVSCLAICCHRHREERIKQFEKQLRRDKIREAKAKRLNQLRTFSTVDIENGDAGSAPKRPEKQRRKKDKATTPQKNSSTVALVEAEQKVDVRPKGNVSSIEMTVWSDSMTVGEGEQATTLEPLPFRDLPLASYVELTDNPRQHHKAATKLLPRLESEDMTSNE